MHRTFPLQLVVLLAAAAAAASLRLSDECTSLNANPFARGAEVPCCAGSEKCL
eukprot:CAMPEP_0115100250 /NCGR_PEP_ID=MMETSP0227-20121206/32428_1 /TAXON_ID=89957 /ORGANISM="Polarella glacialis, Strain CCMP 1383" /LENGTH=52 /DNA_ID=CAMNT_0002495581 /DNA_START=56 /DNA_END=211 /DNA_ORIENTATION=-